MASIPVLPQAIATGLVTILPADTTTLKTLVTAGSSGTKVTGISITSSDTVARVVQLYITRSGTDFLLRSLSVAALSGFDGTTQPVDFFATTMRLPVDNDGQNYMLLKSGDVLKVAVTVAVTAAKFVHAAAFAADF